MNLDADKKALRVEARTRRLMAFDRHGAVAGEKIAEHGLGFSEASPPMIVSGFSSIGDELDVRPLMRVLHEGGFKLALPVIKVKGEPLIMRSWAPGEPLEKRTWGIEEPLDSAPEVLPDVMLVPLLAFDDEGYRLGYGGGFYDRTLEKVRSLKPVIAIGVAFDEQRVDAVPREGYDQPCDWILTPSGPRRCTSAAKS